MKVHPENKELVEYLKLDMEEGPWVAGGACIEWFNGNQVIGAGDIDVWFKSMDQYDAMLKRMCLDGWCIKHQSKNATTLSYEDFPYNWGRSKPKAKLPSSFENVNVQLICKQFYESAQDILSTFDFSICKIATDGEEFIWSDTTISDLRSMVLEVVDIRKDILKRMTKYISYGYTPSQDLVERIAAAEIDDELTGDAYDF